MMFEFNFYFWGSALSLLVVAIVREIINFRRKKDLSRENNQLNAENKKLEEQTKVSPFWDIFKQSTGEVGVVMSARDGLEDTTSPHASFKEIEAAVLLQTEAALMGRKTQLMPGDSSGSDIRNKDLILLGGPNGNEASKYYLEELSDRIPFKIDPEKETIVSVDSNKEFTSDLKSSGNSYDYGLLARMRNPLAGGRPLLMSIGCHGHGTKGCISFLDDEKKCNALHEQVGTSDFAAVIQTKILNGDIVGEKLADFALLKQET